MAKLYFRYGTVCSAKSLHAIDVVKSYQFQNKKVISLVPGIQQTYLIKSRLNDIAIESTYVIHNEDDVAKIDLEGVVCIVADEVNFFSPKIIEMFRDIATYKNIPVICYGLKVDYKTRLFEGSKRLIELADSIDEIKSICFDCNHKANLNGKTSGEDNSTIIQVNKSFFLPFCYSCYHKNPTVVKND